jgi:hypothetical protein
MVTLVTQKRQALPGPKPVENSAYPTAAIGRAIVEDGSDLGQRLGICCTLVRTTFFDVSSDALRQVCCEPPQALL